MKINMRILKTCGVLLITLAAGKVAAQNLTDVVLVHSQDAFYIQIFEASKGEVRNAGINSSYGTSRQGKPDRLNFNEAKNYCRIIGMEIPTKSQWKQAASNLGQNTNFSHRSDSFSRSKTNINSGDSVETTRISRIGIDAIGTVAMSGNRAEWVAEGNQCGGSYQTRSSSDIKLSNICKTSGNFESPTATVRCVIPENGQTISLSSKVKAELRQYLSSRGNENVVSNAAPSQSNQAVSNEPAQITMDDLDIDDNESSFN